MLEIFKYGVGFYIKSTFIRKTNIVVEYYNIKKEVYENPTVIATLEYGKHYIFNPPVDGKYRLSIRSSSLVTDTARVNQIDYKYIEHYSVYLRQTIEAVKDFLCADCSCPTDGDGDKLESGNYAISMLLGYYNLCTNSSFNSYQLCSGNVIDLFTRKMFDFYRLDFLSEFTSMSKSNCLTNSKITAPSLKKITSVYSLALYNYEIYNQISLDSGENKLDEINKLYDISAIKRCITKQGFDFETSVELFNEIKPEERLVRGVNKFYELDSNIITEKYSFEINPKDIYNLPQVDVLRNTIYLDLITLPIIGNLIYQDKYGNLSKITTPSKILFNLLTTEKLIYEYDMLSDTASDLFLYNVTNIEDECKGELDYNTITIQINEYEYEENIVPLNVVSIKVHEEILLPFNYYHIYKILKRKIDLYSIKSIALNTDSEYVKFLSDAGDLLEGQQPIADFSFNTFIQRGVSLNIGDPYRGTIEVEFLNGTKYEVAIFFRVTEEDELDNTFPYFTVNSLDESVTEINFPFYDREYPLYADTINTHREPVIFYFSKKDRLGGVVDIQTVSNNYAILKSDFPKVRYVTIVANTNKNTEVKELTLDNTRSDIRITWNSIETNQLITLGVNELGEGKIINAAWDPNVINKNASYRYPTLVDKVTYLEVFPHDRFRYNNPRLKDIRILGTFRRIDLNSTSIGNKRVTLLNDLEQRTQVSNIENLPIGVNGYPVYFLAKSVVGFTEPKVYPTANEYSKAYKKGILISLATADNKNPMPISDLEATQDYPDFNIVIKQAEVIGNFPYITASIDIIDKSVAWNNIAKVPVYARLEGLRGADWVKIGAMSYYETLKMYDVNNDEAFDGKITSAVSTQGLTADLDGYCSFRMVYQGLTGSKISNIIKAKAITNITESLVSRIEVTALGINVHFTEKLVPNKVIKIGVYGDKGGDAYIVEEEFFKPNDFVTFTYISLSMLTQEIINKAALYLFITDEDNHLLESVPFPESKYRVSIIPNAESGYSVAKTYDLDINGNPSEIDSAILLDNVINIEKFVPLKGGIIFYQVEVYYSLNDVSYTFLTRGENNDPYIRIPLSLVGPSPSRVYLKSRIQVRELVGTEVSNVDKIDTYSIQLNLSYTN